MANPFQHFIPADHHEDLGLLANASNETVQEMTEQFIRKMDFSSITNPNTAVGAIMAIVMSFPEPLRLFVSSLAVGAVTRKLPKAIRGPTHALLAGTMTGAQLAMQTGNHASVASMFERLLGITPPPTSAPGATGVPMTTPTAATTPTTPAAVTVTVSTSTSVPVTANEAWQTEAINLLKALFDLNIWVDCLDVPWKPRLTYRRLTEMLLKRPGLVSMLPQRELAWYAEGIKIALEMIRRQGELNSYSTTNPRHRTAIAQRETWMRWAKAELEGTYFIPYGQFFLYVDAAAESSDTKVGDGLDRLVDAGGDLFDSLSTPEMRQYIRDNAGTFSGAVLSHGRDGFVLMAVLIVSVLILALSGLGSGIGGTLAFMNGAALAWPILIPWFIGFVLAGGLGGLYVVSVESRMRWLGLMPATLGLLMWVPQMILTNLNPVAPTGAMGMTVSAGLLLLFWAFALIGWIDLVTDGIHSALTSGHDGPLHKLLGVILDFVKNKKAAVLAVAGVSVPPSPETTRVPWWKKAGGIEEIGLAAHYGSLMDIIVGSTLILESMLLWAMVGFSPAGVTLSVLTFLGAVLFFAETMRRSVKAFYFSNAEWPNVLDIIKMRVTTVYVATAMLVLSIVWMAINSFMANGGKAVASRGLDSTLGWTWPLFAVIMLVANLSLGWTAVSHLKTGDWQKTGYAAIGSVIAFCFLMVVFAWAPTHAGDLSSLTSTVSILRQ